MGLPGSGEDPKCYKAASLAESRSPRSAEPHPVSDSFRAFRSDVPLTETRSPSTAVPLPVADSFEASRFEVALRRSSCPTSAEVALTEPPTSVSEALLPESEATSPYSSPCESHLDNLIPYSMFDVSSLCLSLFCGCQGA